MPITQRPLLQTKGLSLRFGGLSVLQDVSLQVNAGEVLALIGPNGAGKTALVNCITGVFHPSAESQVELNGRRIDRVASHRLRSLGLSRTFQHIHLIAEMTAIENVLLGLTPAFPRGLLAFLARPFRSRRREREQTELARHMLDLCGASKYLGVPAALLPLGIRRRVDLARALVGKPSVLLLDEPASGLSHEERSLIPELIGIAQAQRDLAVIWIEHDLDLVLSHADRVIVLHYGKVVHNAPITSDQTSRDAVVRAYMTGK